MILQKLLAKRFGNVSGWAEQKILSARPEQLADWAVRVLDGKSVEDVLTVNEGVEGYGGERDGPGVRMTLEYCLSKNAHYGAPPPQIRTCGTTASGSCLE